jgi:hypothetical protein
VRYGRWYSRITWLICSFSRNEPYRFTAIGTFRTLAIPLTMSVLRRLRIVVVCHHKLKVYGMNAFRTIVNCLAGSLTSGYILLFGFGLSLVLLIGFGLSLDAAHAFGEATCKVADSVRFQLNGIEYRIPVALQPTYSPERALPTLDYFPKGVRTKQYCQSPQSSPAVVDSISFPRKSLIAWAREDVDRAELVGIFPLAIKRSFRSNFPVGEGGQTTPDGLFRRIDRGERFEIISIEPMFFGAIIYADCGPAGTLQPSTECTIWGRLLDGSLVMLGVHDTEKPINGWPRMLRQVEAFILSMAIDVR